MNILDVIMSAQEGSAVRQAGAQVGLGEAETATALSALVPALAAGFQRNAGSVDGLSGLVAALATGNHQQYIDDPASLARAASEGNGVLAHVLGSKDASRAVAAQASSQTGISPAVLKQLLPIAASMMMGALARQQQTNGGLAAASAGVAAGPGGLLHMLTPLVDRDRDGSMVDDVAGMVGRMFGRP